MPVGRLGAIARLKAVGEDAARGPPGVVGEAHAHSAAARRREGRVRRRVGRVCKPAGRLNRPLLRVSTARVTSSDSEDSDICVLSEKHLMY
jgi:hypothetical protein